MLPRGMARTVSIIGGGRVGATLGKRLRQLGWRVVAVVTRSERSSRAAVRAIGGGSARSLLSADVLDADVILLTTPDNALGEVALSLAKIGGHACRGKVILHTSGALDRGVLGPLARLGASTGSLHPMQTFSGRNMPRLEGVTFAVEGDAKSLRVAKQIARSLGGVPVAVASADKPVYHATAVLAAGSGFALIEAAVRMLVKIGFTRRRAFETLLPLTRQMLDNVERLGPRAAWTGPLSRGDFAVIAKHVRALRRYPREFQESYAALALLAGRVLAKNPDATLRNLRRVLKKSKGDNR
jgi:predicted short-subunit dehydrogenase-like oxidoreductase (DUF2520 family)